MTEPDEALICARQWRSGNLQALGLPSLAQRVADGETDETLESFAHGYRAGQAASAERIKALEEAIRRLTNMLVESDDPPGLIMVVTKDLLDARALLKEADQ
jgi:hypothetical protein